MNRAHGAASSLSCSAIAVVALASAFATTAPACTSSDECGSNDCAAQATGEGDGGNDTDASDRCSDVPPNEPLNERGCPIRLEAVPWSSGPYGTGIRDTAGDFTLETLDGAVTFSQAWTGQDSWVFFAYAPKIPELEQAWASDPLELLKESPPNVHYVFFSTGTDPEADVSALSARFTKALGKLKDSERWNGRLHFVPTRLSQLDPTLEAFTSAHARHRHTSRAFAIDRFQRWRQVGMLGGLTSRGVLGELRFLSRPPHGFNYERSVERERAALKPTEVVLADGFVHPGGWAEGNKSSLEATFPSAEEMKGFDSMAIHAFTSCPNHLEGKENGCPEWDMAQHLVLCDESDPSVCTTEFVRYITTYHREGEWRTDISALLPLLASGGKRTFQYRGPNSYGLHLSIQLWKDPAKKDRPIAIQKLWGAAPDETRWTETYNDALAPATVEINPQVVSMVEIVAALTGHGFGSTNENCAEFCNHQHQFTLNGTPLPLLEYKNGGTPEGCYERVSQGVVPNQWGTWPFGRAGWCPGQDVKFETVDMTQAIRSGPNSIEYKVLFQNTNYTPDYVTPEPNEPYFPHLRTQVWLVSYGAK